MLTVYNLMSELPSAESVNVLSCPGHQSGATGLCCIELVVTKRVSVVFKLECVEMSVCSHRWFDTLLPQYSQSVLELDILYIIILNYIYYIYIEP